MLRLILAGAIALALPLAAFASAIVESVRGAAEAGGKPLMQGQRLFPQSAISTGPGSRVFLKFDDGMQIVLHENSLLRFMDFRFTPTGGTSDRAVFELLRGSARVVTGKVVQHNAREFYFRTPQTELTLPGGADFTVALVNPAYITVNAGTIVSTNGYGPVPLGPGSLTTIATNAAPPIAISASSLPPTASAAMSNLGAVAMSTPAGGAATGVAATAGGIGGAAFAAPIIFIGAVAAGVAAAQSSDDGSSTTTTTTHH